MLSMPYFGTREFPAHFKACEEVPSSCGFYADESERDLGFMLYDMDYRDPRTLPLCSSARSCATG